MGKLNPTHSLTHTLTHYGLTQSDVTHIGRCVFPGSATSSIPRDCGLSAPKFSAIPIHTRIYRGTKVGTVTCLEDAYLDGHARFLAMSRGRASAPQISLGARLHGNQILHGDQTKYRKKNFRVDHAPGFGKIMSVTQTLRRDFFR